MSQREPKNRRRQPGLEDSVPATAGRGSLWLLISGVVIAASVGAVVIERVTRPSADADSQQGVMLPEPARRDRDIAPPPPVRPSLDELTEDANRLADELAGSFADDPKALALSGRISFYFGNVQKAAERWDQSVKLDPRSAEAWLGMAELARKQGDSQRAVECMRRLAEANPAVARENVFLLADALLKLGQAREAVDVLEESGKNIPLPAWAQVMLGQGYYQLKDFQRAAEQYQKALGDPQQTTVAHYGLSSALVRLGRHDEARKYREQYARLQEKNMVAFDRMQQAGTANERRDPVPWYPILAGFHVEAGRLYAIRGQRQRAEEHGLRAWALAPERPEPRRLLEALDGQ